MIEDYDLDLLFVCESWIREEGDEPRLKAIKPKGYRLKPKYRKSDQDGGGILLIYKENLAEHLSFSDDPNHHYTNFETLVVTLRLRNNTHLKIFGVYRPPPSSANGLKTSEFITEFDEFVASQMINRKNIVFIGDFNICFDEDTSVTRWVKTILDDNNLTQHITAPTRPTANGHIVDWVVTEASFSMSSIHNVENKISDHNLIYFTIPTTKPPCEKVQVQSRNVRKINISDLKTDIQTDIERMQKVENVSAENLDSLLRGVFGKHAPLTTRSVNKRKPAPWFDATVKTAKQQKRRAEKKWLRTKSDNDREHYVKCKNELNRLIFKKKSNFYLLKLNNVKNSKEFFSLCSELLGGCKENVLPTKIGKKDLPGEFASYFTQKIRLIREVLDQVTTDPRYENFNGGTFLCTFQEATEEEIAELINLSQSKSCDLDPIPTHLFKTCLDVLLPTVTHIINESLSTGTVPVIYKQALVKPILKKHNLNPENLKNFRPVSNLNFLSKIIEKLVLKRLSVHLQKNGLWELFQSAYRRHHCTETALLRVANDLLQVIDNGECSLLTLLDLSSAFDTIDHNILIKRLETTFGIKEIALDWFRSYLKERSQCVVIDGGRSDADILEYGVPQGSVLGPVLFILYTSSLSPVIQRHQMSYHFYADDTQLYNTNPNLDINTIMTRVEACVDDVKDWMDANKLKMNSEKTEAMLIGSKYRLRNIQANNVTFDGNDIEFVSSCRNLGVYFDSNMSMDTQVNHLCKILNFDLRRLAFIRPYITISACKKLVSSIMFAKLDYCNSILCGIPKTQIQRLQVVQNNAARLTLNKRKFDRATPLLEELHWLPVSQRIDFKINTLVYKSLHGLSPDYLADLLEIYTPARDLRSSDDKMKLVKPRTRTRAGDRSFSCYAARVWNDLPSNLRNSTSLTNFKKDLKTYLFP